MFDDDATEEVASPDCPTTHADRPPADIERQVCKLTLTSSADELAAAMCASEWLTARARLVAAIMKARAVAWIELNGPLTVGHVQYTVSYPVTVKCRDVPGAAEVLLAAVGGDLSQFCGHLVAQPYKHGTVKRTVPRHHYDSLFSGHRTSRLEKGVPQRTLERRDLRFIDPQ